MPNEAMQANEAHSTSKNAGANAQCVRVVSMLAASGVMAIAPPGPKFMAVARPLKRTSTGNNSAIAHAKVPFANEATTPAIKNSSDKLAM